MAALTGRPASFGATAVAATGGTPAQWKVEPGVRFKRLIVQNLDGSNALELSFDATNWFSLGSGVTWAEWVDAHFFYVRGSGANTPAYVGAAIAH